MKQFAGWGMIAAALGLMLYNVSDAVVDLQTWHQATTPQFVGAALKQVAAVILGVTGGAVLPQSGKPS